jgi:hypothetical protein
VTEGFDVGEVAGAAVVLGDAPDVAAGTVLAGPEPATVGEVVDEPRPGMLRVERGGRHLFVLDPRALASGRPVAWLDLAWATRLVALAWLAAPSGGTELPLEARRELAVAALEARSVAR